MATLTIPEIPSLERYEAAGAELRKAHDRLEELVQFSLAAIVREWAPGEDPVCRTPTLADIGALWSHADDLRMRIGDFEHMLETCENALAALDGMRLEGELPQRPTGA